MTNHKTYHSFDGDGPAGLGLCIGLLVTMLFGGAAFVVWYLGSVL